MKKIKLKNCLKILVILSIFSTSYGKVTGVVVDRIFINDRYNIPDNAQNPNIDRGDIDGGDINRGYIYRRPGVVPVVPVVAPGIVSVSSYDNDAFIKGNNFMIGINKISYIKIEENTETNKFDVQCYTTDGGKVTLDSFSSEMEAERYFDDVVRDMKNNGVKIKDR